MRVTELLFLYDEQMYLSGRIKVWLKSVLRRQHRGPQVVVASLKRGLDALSIKWKLNSSEVGTIACVLNGVKTLRWALKQKELKKIKNIIAGPNLVLLPQDAKGILTNPAIDRILVPGQWVYNNYVQDAPEIQSKLRIWPAGVHIPNLPSLKKDIDFLVYNKIGDNLLFSSILEYLSVNHYNFKVLAYGKFEQKQFFSLLERSKYLIYLSESESQGLAMFEAWARDVPILAWERGFCQVGKYFQTGLTTTAYLTPETGMRFKDFVDFKAVCTRFIQAKFTPQAYVVTNFSDEVCARKYLDIVNEINI